MKIVCAGMRRSGSTWLYNVARLACMADGPTYACFEDRLAGATEAKHVVIKAHKFDQALALAADVVLVSIRDLRDVAASAVRRGLCRPTTEQVVRYLLKTAVNEYECWESLAPGVVHYETMIHDKDAEITRVLDMGSLPRAVDDVTLSAQVNALRPPGQGVNSTSLLHHDHFTDGKVGTYAETINERIVAAIEVVFGDWMRARGYEIP